MLRPRSKHRCPTAWGARTRRNSRGDMAILTLLDTFNLFIQKDSSIFCVYSTHSTPGSTLHRRGSTGAPSCPRHPTRDKQPPMRKTSSTIDMRKDQPGIASSYQSNKLRTENMAHAEESEETVGKPDRRRESMDHCLQSPELQ